MDALATPAQRERGISALLPVRDRQASIEGAILDLAAVLDALTGTSFEIVVVNEGSRDATLQVLDELQLRFPNLPLRVLHRSAGLEYAALTDGPDLARYSLVLFAKADGAYDVRELNRLVDALDDETDMVVGFRTARTRRVFRRLLFRGAVRDGDCAFKLFRRDLWQKVASQPRAAMLGNLLGSARRYGFRIKEVPVRHTRPSLAA